MTDTLVSRRNKKTLALRPLRKADLEAWRESAEPSARAWAEAHAFAAKPGELLAIPAEGGKISEILFGRGSQIWGWSQLPGRLPQGRYEIEAELSPAEATDAALGWGLACYRFDRYKTDPETKAKAKALPQLVWPKGADPREVGRLLEAVSLVRDLINTPAEDMGPADLHEATRKLGRRYGARVTAIVGKKLLEEGYPAVHAVGRAASREPRFIDLTWTPKAPGSKRGRSKKGLPRLTLVGKGVCFDTGGLDLKPSSSMLTMKKDMGGAAHVLGLALLVMDAELPVRLRVLIPAVENSVSGNAMRPKDVIRTRKGLTVEIGNTDAEGRLILSDGLAEASREGTDLLLDFATLTGAARIALGADLPALFCNNDELASQILDKSVAVDDPLWRMPLFRAYRRKLDSKVADINNISSSRLGGAIAAALFLEEFVGEGIPWAHIDVMAWNSESRAGRPAGGEAMGLRAVWAALQARFTKK